MDGERIVKKGGTSYIASVFVQDTSASYPTGLTGLTSASGGLTCYYKRSNESASTAITLSAGTIGTYSSGGFVEVDGTNLPGVYELGVPNEVLRTGADSAALVMHGASNMGDTAILFRLWDYLPADNYSIVSDADTMRTKLGAVRIESDLRRILSILQIIDNRV